MGYVTPLGVITGLQVEARIAQDIPGALVMCLGPGPIKALQAAEALADQGAQALMSFGIAGGLDPALAAGDLVVSPQALGEPLGAKASTVATVTDPALTPEDKAALLQSSQAAAVDMETSAVQDAASARGLPFLCVRAICDEAGDTIPEIALKGVSPNGETRPVRVAAGLLTRPQDLGHLMTLGQRQKAALAALRRAVKALAYSRSSEISS
ncbi:MAG: nucleoside phosphorylase [Pseudomonadota bacterium]